MDIDFPFIIRPSILEKYRMGGIYFGKVTDEGFFLVDEKFGYEEWPCSIDGNILLHMIEEEIEMMRKEKIG